MNASGTAAAITQPTTRGRLLDGRLRYDQSALGHRSGIEPVFLAASIPARPGQRLLEAGTGAGAALLCIAARVEGIEGVGVERDAALARLADANFAANGFAGLRATVSAVEAFLPDAPFDHAMANPPWHAASGTASPDAGREFARRADAGLLARWMAAMARCLRRRGTLTLVAAATVIPDWLAALPDCGCGSPAILPLWPHAGAAARLALLQAVRHGRAPLRLLPGLALHDAAGRFTRSADAVLREGGAIEWS